MKKTKISSWEHKTCHQCGCPDVHIAGKYCSMMCANYDEPPDNDLEENEDEDKRY